MKTSEIIAELANLPTDERALIADSLLQSLNPTQQSTEQSWVKLAQQRLTEISTGQVQPVAAETVFDQVNKPLGA